MITLDKCPPLELLEEATQTGELEDLEAWFIAQSSPGYSFQTIVDFVAENSKPKAKRAPGKGKARKAPTEKEEAITL